MRKLLASLMLVAVAAFATPAVWGGQGQDFSVSNILSKLGVRDRTRAVLKAIQYGYL